MSRPRAPARGKASAAARRYTAVLAGSAVGNPTTAISAPYAAVSATARLRRSRTASQPRASSAQKATTAADASARPSAGAPVKVCHSMTAVVSSRRPIGPG